MSSYLLHGGEDLGHVTVYTEDLVLPGLEGYIGSLADRKQICCVLIEDLYSFLHLAHLVPNVRCKGTCMVRRQFEPERN